MLRTDFPPPPRCARHLPRLRGRKGNGLRARGANEPARFSGAGFGLRIEAQEKSRHTALGCGQDQSSARRKIENPWRPRNFDDERAERCAGQRIGTRTQDGCRVWSAQQEKPVGIEPQFEEPGGRNFPMLQRGEIRPEPEDSSVPGRAGGQSCDKPGRYGLIARRGRKNLVQRPLENPPMQAGVRRAMPQRRPRLIVRIPQPRPGKAAPQKSDLLGRRIHGRPA